MFLRAQWIHGGEGWLSAGGASANTVGQASSCARYSSSSQGSASMKFGIAPDGWIGSTQAPQGAHARD